MAEISELVKRLNDAIDKANANKAWFSTPDGTTFCNDYCYEITSAVEPDAAKFMLGPDGKLLMATPIGEKILKLIDEAKALGKPCDWRVDVAERFQAHANKGGLGFGWAGAPPPHHGHIVVGAPGEMQDSGTFKTKVPWVASIARYNMGPNRTDKASMFYRPDNRPIFLLFRSEEDA